VERTRAAPEAVLAGVPGGPGDRRSLSPYLVLMVLLLAALGVLLFFLARELGVGNAGPAKVVVPNVVGDPEEAATARLRSLGFRVERQTAPDDNYEPGKVKEQRPADGTQLAKGAAVTLVVSTGPETKPVPAVKGLSAGDAQAKLTAAGFTPSLNARPDDKVPADTVLDQDPAANTQLPKGGTVTLTVSSGPDKVAVPDVTGRSAADAANILGRAGLETQVRSETSPTVPEGGVIRTSPAPGTMVAKGSTVTLVVSAGAPATTTTTTEPDITTTTRATTTVTLF
jgi:serine/threonine-protein kinase